MDELVVTTEDGATFIFVTREGTEPFTLEEAYRHLGERTKLSFPDRPIVPQKDLEVSCWQIPDDKMRRHIFRQDLKSGVDFCVQKYGQSKETILAEARRLSIGGF